jgi:hypothetical protein
MESITDGRSAAAEMVSFIASNPANFALSMNGQQWQQWQQ